MATEMANNNSAPLLSLAMVQSLELVTGDDEQPEQAEVASTGAQPATDSNGAATAREPPSASQEHLQLRTGSTTHHTLPPTQRLPLSARVRYAPPRLAKRPKARPSKLHRLQTHRGTASSLQLVQAQEQDDVAESLARMLKEKQEMTLRAFTFLRQIYEEHSAGSIKALLYQALNVLERAAYRVDSGSNNSSSNNDCRDTVNEASDEDELHDDEQGYGDDDDGEEGRLAAGREFFSLLYREQLQLETLRQEHEQVDARLALEKALEDDLRARFQQLEHDFRDVRSKHLINHELMESEHTAVTKLEQEYVMLMNQEHAIKVECEQLTSQLEKHQVAMKELRARASYLEFISRIPMKKHMEERKIRDQEDAMNALVQQALDENTALEEEIKRLDMQIISLEDQFVKDVELKEQTERELAEAEVERTQREAECARVRGCHTPRPDWEAIVETTPELASQQYQWEATAPPLSGSLSSDGKAHVDDALDTNADNVHGSAADQNAWATKKLVKEMIHWIDRLQKHCGVSLHLSRIWHDVEEARVELNILHHQLDKAVKKYNKAQQQQQQLHGPPGTPNIAGVGVGATVALGAGAGSASPTSRHSKQEFVVALGNSDEIPKFLRHQGKIKHRPLKKVELEMIIRKVWSEKRKRELRNHHIHLPLEEVLFEKLQRKYGFQPLIAEWGYNILMALNTYIWDAEVEMFLLCLTGAITDLVYVDQEEMLLSCQNLLLRLSESYRNESFVTERRVLLKDALVTLRKFFPLKTTVQLQAIEKAMIRDMHKMKRGGNDSILYIEDILPLNVNYPRGFFVKTLRTQHFKEIQDYYAALVSELTQRDTSQTGNLPPSDVQDAMIAIDPMADANAIVNAISKAMGVKSRFHLKMHDVVNYKLLLKKMNTTVLMKFSINYDPQAEIYWQRGATSDRKRSAQGDDAGASIALSSLAAPALATAPPTPSN